MLRIIQPNRFLFFFLDCNEWYLAGLQLYCILKEQSDSRACRLEPVCATGTIP